MVINWLVQFHQHWEIYSNSLPCFCIVINWPVPFHWHCVLTESTLKLIVPILYVRVHVVKSLMAPVVPLLKKYIFVNVTNTLVLISFLCFGHRTVLFGVSTVPYFALYQTTTPNNNPNYCHEFCTFFLHRYHRARYVLAWHIPMVRWIWMTLCSVQLVYYWQYGTRRSR